MSAEYHPPEAKCEIEIARGVKAVPKRFSINGVEVPNVARVTVEYSPRDARRVIFEVFATDVIEVDAVVTATGPGAVG